MTAFLTNHSTIELISSMGDDLTVVNAARVSFDKRSLEFEGKDAGLIRYLAKNSHWTPFAHVMFTFRIKMPVFVARQWFRHTTGLVRNEVSRRYVDDLVQFYLPDELRQRPEVSIKQGSGGAHLESHHWRSEINNFYDIAEQLYSDMIADGVAPEQARMVLPLAHMTEFYETASLAAYGRIAGLRLDGHAQKEIQDVAQLVSDLIAPICPVAWKALTPAAHA